MTGAMMHAAPADATAMMTVTHVVEDPVTTVKVADGSAIIKDIQKLRNADGKAVRAAETTGAVIHAGDAMMTTVIHAADGRVMTEMDAAGSAIIVDILKQQNLAGKTAVVVVAAATCAGIQGAVHVMIMIADHTEEGPAMMKMDAAGLVTLKDIQKQQKEAGGIANLN